MKNIVLTMSVALAALCGAAAEISDVIVRQQWPWSNVVAIDFVLRDGEGATHDLSLSVADGDTPIEVLPGSVTGKLEDVAPGAYRLVWNPKTEGKAVVYNNLKATVSLADDPKKWMIIDISGGTATSPYDVSYAMRAPEGGWCQNEYRTDKIVLRHVRAGSFMMGSTNEVPLSEFGLYEVRHRCTFTRDFYLAVFPTTEKQYVNLMGALPSGMHTKLGDTGPVNYMSYAMLRGSGADSEGVWPNLGSGTSFFGTLNEKAPLSGDMQGYRFDLPSAAQWEYACRAGTTSTWYNGLTYVGSEGDYSRLGEIALYGNNGQSAVVGEGRLPNAWGLYDMIGNVREFVRDILPYYSSSNPLNYMSADVTGIDCVYYRKGGHVWFHGGEFDTACPRTTSWADYALDASKQGGYPVRNGFRIACTYFE